MPAPQALWASRGHTFGKDHYVGPWKSKASRAKYDRLIGEWLAAGRSLPKLEAQLTIAELAPRYLNFAKR